MQNVFNLFNGMLECITCFFNTDTQLLGDGFVFETIDAAKKFINERIYIEAEKDSNSPSMKGRDN